MSAPTNGESFSLNVLPTLTSTDSYRWTMMETRFALYDFEARLVSTYSKGG
jgi:hypothetical protein